MIKKIFILCFLICCISFLKVHSQCAILGNKTITLISGGGNGTSGSPYTVGAVIQVCVTVDSFIQINTNWLHGVYLTGLPPGSIVNPGTPVPGSPWMWDSIGCNSRPKGWYFDEDADDDPCSNFGDQLCGDDLGGPCGLTFCFAITLGSNVGSSQINVKTTGDGTTGSWLDSGCDDPAVNVGAPIHFGASITCPSLTLAPGVTITDNPCGAGCAPIRTGTINTSGAGCPSGSTLRWFTNASTTTGGVTTLPTYSAGQSYHARCLCDANNNVISPVTTITAASQCPIDIIPPTITCPANVTVSGCYANQADAIAAIPAADTSLVAASDMNGPVVITHVGDANPINTSGCAYIVQRTYRATDLCNNFNECNQLYTVYFGCSYTTTCSAIANTRCSAPFNGSVTVITDATSPSYLWSNGNTNASQNALASGTYTVTVTDGVSGCTSSCSATLANNLVNPAVICSSTDNTLCVGANGSLTATATGVSYSWSNGSTNASQSGLSAGTYTVVVTDLVTGCTASCTATIASNTSNPTVTCSGTNNTNCVQPNGSVTACNPTEV
ncbi:MAG: hypothetical protein IPO27_10975 [Bacteroidetes bacterium]|nr:hypothetical protein [Bacteroidota bacterium]